ncbi:hypothetical protein CDAR_29961 [Caerostris darwini]|uniref:Nuclear speckle splicing regulatory protein 1 N-terminal domain-containing protein n=1 Tax=Caerostris darwini TaxID=1538125 RepID=A0AAV4S8L2_9ARAC|nr:hypothetical protein CDAR_29961 [Caerostris darwini]
MKAKEVAKIAVPKDKKPSRYIDTLLKAADKRKNEYKRRIERKVEVELEKEGDKFNDKESFVTSTYKKKLQEMEEEEERERHMDQLNEMMDVTKQKDLSGFYKHFLNQTVGEEKVPVLGKKPEIKQEVLSDDECHKTANSPIHKKNKNCIESNENKVASGPSIKIEKVKEYSKQDYISEKHNASNIIPQTESVLENIDADSDLVSSGEEETNNIYGRGNILKDKNQDSDSDVSDSNSEKDISKRKRIFNRGKNIRKRINEDSSDSDSPKENDDKNASLIEKDTTNGQSESQTVEEQDTVMKKKPRKNMFEKRTIGNVFADAQAFFFQRMALHSQ